MKTSNFKLWLAATASSAMIAGMMAAPAYAQIDDTVIDDEIITIGTRRTQRSAADTPAPVDVISAGEFTANAANDVQDLLRTSVPSYNVNTQPISDAASVVRPANLRGLSPDNTLVLVNGKRRHRGAVISFLGGGIADGAQGVDVSSIPSIALKQVEILRDGASSQYGSDAIAGVINFTLRDAPEGGQLEAKFGSTYEGDGDNYSLGANLGFGLGDQGFVNVAAEYGATDGTVRAAPRNDVNALIGAGVISEDDFFTINSYTDEFTQYWGQPDVEGDLKFSLNSALELSEKAELYAFGTYAERQTTGGFFFRNPTNRGGVYAGPRLDPRDPSGFTAVTLFDDQGTDTSADDIYVAPDGVQFGIADTITSIRVGDLDGLGVGGACPVGIPLTGTDNLVTDPAVQGVVGGDANCFAFNETIPTGFVPRFGGNLRDFSIATGIRGDLDLGNGLSYDLSVTHGQSKVDFFINNTINASLGPDTPRDFIPGGQEQIETVVNADFGYSVPTGMASDLSVAFGGEYRREQFDLIAGDPASYALGPLATQGFSSSSNGFGGFPNSSSNSQDSYAGYLDLEADVTDQLTLGAAIRYEDYSAFGDTFNYKIAGLYKLNDNVRLRGTYSTGFHAPTAGQANITNVTTQITSAGVLTDRGTLPLNTAAGQLAADFLEATEGSRPTLGAEDARNISAGIAFDTAGMSWTVDYFNISVKDRVALGNDVNFLAALQNAGASATTTTVSEALTELNAAGTINRADFAGLDDLVVFRFFTNSFDTKTQGIDVVGRYPFEMMGGDSAFVLAANWTDTEVTDRGDLNPISDSRIAALEELLPNVKGSATLTHDQGIFRGLLRANYYGGWFDEPNEYNPGSEILIDAEVGAEVTDGIELIVGANNLFDNYPDQNPGSGGSGQLYPEASPIGFAGGQWYGKVRIKW